MDLLYVASTDLLNVAIWVIAPIGGAAILITLLIVVGQIIKSRLAAASLGSFKKLAISLQEENAKIMAGLSAMKETLGSIDKMMKEIG